MPPSTMANAIALSLRDLGVETLFGVVGIPVVDIAEEAIDLGIRFIGFRNEQACSYAASAYGYITGKPGVCLLVGGPGVLHGIAGIENCSVNAFPALFLAGSCETSLVGKGAFQELDAISFLTPHTKYAIRPSPHLPQAVADCIRNAYHVSGTGRPGPTFVDLPADLIMKKISERPQRLASVRLAQSTKPYPDPALVTEASNLLKASQSPLIIIGKGAAYARAEDVINRFVTSTHIPFLPTPMGKGVVSDGSELNASAARSTALREADVILILGARLNWILHFGDPMKFRPDVKVIQVDISAEDLGWRNAVGESSLGIVSDIGAFVQALHTEMTEKSQPTTQDKTRPFLDKLSAASVKNETKAQTLATSTTKPGTPLTYQRAFHLIKETLHHHSPPSDGNIVYISEGANTMDISRSIFPLHHPRQRLDAGTHATMGVGMGYAIAAYTAHNLDSHNSQQKKKKIVAFEGDSAIGFSAMEIETMQRYKMPILIFVMNNSGVYHGDSASATDWHKLQDQTLSNTQAPDDTVSSSSAKRGGGGLRSTTLSYETRYEKLAEMVGGRGALVRTEDELLRATNEGFQDEENVWVVNVIIEPGIGKEIGFAWQKTGGEKGEGEGGRESKL